MNYTCLSELPPVSKSPVDISALFGPASEPFQHQVQAILGAKRNYLGCDLEFDKQDRPTVLGLSDGAVTVSVPWSAGVEPFRELVEKYRPVFVGHFFLSADLFVFKNIGIDIDICDVQSTEIWHYLVNPHLCKGTGKTEDNDGAKRGKGYMNLWTFCSLYTSAWNWKDHKADEVCNDCPECDVWKYNGEDSINPLLALPNVVRTARIRGVSKLYDLHRELVYVLAEMSNYGLQTDTEYIRGLQAQLESDRGTIASTLPFSPTSPKQIVEYFKGKGIHLADAQETTVREACEGSDDAELRSLLEFKELGKGASAWFGENFVDANGRVHPRLQIFTSSGRLACSSPNFQNLPHWRVDRKTGENIGARVRRGVIASPGTYLCKFDLKNGEGRVVFNFSGYDVPPDAHTWVAEMIGLTPDMEYCQREGGPRQGGKKISHSQSYLEGLQLKSPADLRSDTVKREIKFGARVVYPNWTFEGKVVTFTGANFAERVWGSKSWENRKKAIDLIEGQYFKNLPGIRDWHQRITKDCERYKAVRTPLGYHLESYGPLDERMKTCAAVHGSQPVGQITKIALIRAWKAFKAGRPMRPLLQEHDSILYEVVEHVPPEQAIQWMKEDGEVELPEIPGLRIPLDCGVSLPIATEPSNWRDVK